MRLPPMIPVISSKIKEIGHDQTTNSLYVEFMNKTMWRYWPVKHEEYKELMKSESIGSAQGRLVKDRNMEPVKKII